MPQNDLVSLIIYPASIITSTRLVGLSTKFWSVAVGIYNHLAKRVQSFYTLNLNKRCHFQ